MKVFCSDRFTIPLPRQHKFPIEKYRMLKNVVRNDKKFKLIEGPPVALDLLKSVHDPDYVDRVLEGRLSAFEIRELGFPWSPDLVTRSLFSVGSTLSAVKSAIEEKSSCTLAGGTHHSAYSRGYGFCVFNDIAVACYVARKTHPGIRITVIDTDVHQGDGTAMMMLRNPDVTTFSLHANSNFPPEKRCSDFDIFLPNNVDDFEYLAIFESGLCDILGTRKPDLIIFVSGADIFKEDRLGRLSISKKGIQLRDQILFKHAGKVGAKVATLMAGGYSCNLEDIVDIHFSTVKTAYEYWCS